jgi:hypothetical protein
MSTILEARAIITAEAKGFADVEKKLQGLAGSVKALGKLSSVMAANQAASAKMIGAMSNFENRTASSRMIERLSRLGSQAEQTARQLTNLAAAEDKVARAHARVSNASERRAEAIRHHGIVNYAAGTAASYVGAHGVMGAVEHTLKAGARYQHETVALQNAGRTPEEMKLIEEASRRTAALLPTAAYEENLKVVAETTGAFGDLHHAIENLTFMQKSSAVLQAAAGDKIADGPGELGNKLARFFEMRGTAGDTETFQKEAGEMVRAMAFTRGKFNPEEMLNFAQQAKGALQNYSLRFVSKIVPSLVTEMGGDRAGTAANAWRNVLMGKVNDTKQAEAWLKDGLLDPKKVQMKRGHAVAWSAGAVKDTELALSDPLAWVEKHELPAAQKQGVNIDDPKALSIFLATRFRNSNANFFAEQIAQKRSRSRLHKDENNTNQAGTIDDIYDRNIKSDPTVAINALKASLDNLMAAASSPAMKKAAEGITFVAASLQSLAAVAKDHPMTAMATGGVLAGGALGASGYLAYSLMNGFGLSTSAGLLDKAAGDLSAAAVKLGGGVPGGKAQDAATGAGWLAFLARILPPAILGGTAESTPNPDPTPDQRADAKRAERAYAKSHGGYWHPIDDLSNWWHGGPGAPPPMPPSDPVPEFTGGWRGFHNTGSFKPPIGPITAQVTGEANVNVAVSVALTSEALRAIATAKSIKMPLKTGVSMPEASPHDRGDQ